MSSAASPSHMGRFETRWLASDKNLSALADLSGRWIDRVHSRQPPRGVLLDMDSSVSPTHGEQEKSCWNGRYECTCYHPLFLFNQFGYLERCALRSSNVHSATGWEDVLKPVVARYRGQVSRIHFRGDAGFANPDIYDYLEAEGSKIGHPFADEPHLAREDQPSADPSGRTPAERGPAFLCELQLPGRKLDEAAPGRRQGRMACGRALSARRLRRHQFGAARRECRRLLQQAPDLRAMDKGGQSGDQLDASVMPLLRRRRLASSASRARLESRLFPAHAGDAGADQGLVADNAQGEAD
jgi:hypothetical protein